MSENYGSSAAHVCVLLDTARDRTIHEFSGIIHSIQALKSCPACPTLPGNVAHMFHAAVSLFRTCSLLNACRVGRTETESKKKTRLSKHLNLKGMCVWLFSKTSKTKNGVHRQNTNRSVPASSSRSFITSIIPAQHVMLRPSQTVRYPYIEQFQNFPVGVTGPSTWHAACLVAQCCVYYAVL